jgi:hypothetical protein
MRLTVNLDDDLYGVARSLAKAEDISISEAVNRLLRSWLEAAGKPAPRDRTGLPVSRSKRIFGPEDVARVEAENT